MRWYVPPAKAMGTFLRTWRAEWAGLSRAQLAMASSAQCDPPGRITPRIIREWEEGQPPQSSAELNALLEVMRRHRLPAPEVKQFREAVFAACADRRFPEFFDDVPLALRKDVDEIADATWNLWHANRSSVNVIHIVASVEELRRRALGDSGACPNPARERRQAAAAIRLADVLASCHAFWGRHREASVVSAANAELLDLYFGPGGLGQRPFTSLVQRISETHQMIEWGQPALAGERLLRLGEQARDQGSELDTVECYFEALHAFAQAGQPLYNARRVEIEESLSRWSQLVEPSRTESAHFNLFFAAVDDTPLDGADRHLAALDRWRRGSDYESCWWQIMAARLAMKRRAYSDAMAFWETAAAIHAEWYPASSPPFADAMRTCEYALGGNRRISSGRLGARAHGTRRPSRDE